MKWRVVPLETHSAATNMAIDEAVCESIARKNSPPTIRFYRWKPSAVSIGCFQSLAEEVNLEKCRELGIDFVRRRTGAGAVYHDHNGEITYSVLAPKELLPNDVTKIYKEVCGWIVKGLANLGIESNFAPINDILASGKKISGSALTIRDGIVQQHGTVLYDLDVRTMFTVLKVGIEKISDKVIQSVEERVTRVLNFKDIPMEELHSALVKGFTEGKEWEEAPLKPAELSRAKELAEERYGSMDWNASR